jgi:hypothetical protein
MKCKVTYHYTSYMDMYMCVWLCGVLSAVGSESHLSSNQPSFSLSM